MNFFNGIVEYVKLLDDVRNILRLRHYSYQTEKTYIHWIKQYIYFHKITHPKEMGAAEITAFPTHPAVKENVSASTQKQALFFTFISLPRRVRQGF